MSGIDGKTARTAEEAFGHQIAFDKRDPDKFVGVALVLIFTFLAGLWAGGGL